MIGGWLCASCCSGRRRGRTARLRSDEPRADNGLVGDARSSGIFPLSGWTTPHLTNYSKDSKANFAVLAPV